MQMLLLYYCQLQTWEKAVNGDLARCDKQIVDAGRVAILKRLKDAGVGDLTPHILREVIYSPPTW
jgi:hypothetical protein